MKFLIVLMFFASFRCWYARTEPIELSVYNVGNIVVPQIGPVSYQTVLGLRPVQRCIKNNVLINCPTSRSHMRKMTKNIRSRYTQFILNPSKIVEVSSTEKQNYRRVYDADLTHVDLKMRGGLTSPLTSRSVKKLNLDLDALNLKPVVQHNITKTSSKIKKVVETEAENETASKTQRVTAKTAETIEKNSSKETVLDENVRHKSIDGNSLNRSFINTLDKFERTLYAINFNKFLDSQASSGENGMSFVQSGVFLGMALLALSTEVDLDTKNEIHEHLGFNLTDSDKIKCINQVISTLPHPSKELRFRWSSRLVLRSGQQVTEEFSSGTAKALRLRIDYFKGNETPEAMAEILNKMIYEDSSGAIRDTFEEDDLSENEESILLTTLYFRPRWNSAPTLLNGTWIFRDTENAPSRTVRMIRINDVMKYVDLPEWDAQAIEVSYSTKGLTLLMLVPRGISLKPLVGHLTNANLTSVTEKMQTIRIAAIVPLYTLRMTLLLPNKLEAMGISRLVNTSEAKNGSLRISQAVQRIMFWAEAGRNAYKDDGLEWDEPPEMEVMVDRPYIFFVRWKKLTLLSGNFVL